MQIHGLLLRSAGVPANGQGLRPPAGRSEVRAREGEPDPHPLPHLAEQDDRRALRAPAQRARLATCGASRARGVAGAPVLVITGPSGVGKGTLIQRPARALSAAASSPSRPPRARRAPARSTAATTTSSTSDEFERARRGGEFIEHAEYAGNRYGTLRSRARAPGRRRSCWRSTSRARARCARPCPRPRRSSSRRRRRRGPRSAGSSARGSDTAEQIARAARAARRGRAGRPGGVRARGRERRPRDGARGAGRSSPLRCVPPTSKERP